MDLPLQVVLSAATDEALSATENRIGVEVDLGRDDVTAVYHDGLWALGPGPDEVAIGPLTFHWDTTKVHSITARGSGGAFAVRGSRVTDVTFEDLVATAVSIALPA